MAVNTEAALPVRPSFWQAILISGLKWRSTTGKLMMAIVLCVARAKSDCVIEVGVESHDKLYRNPFLDPLAPHELKADIATSTDKIK